MAHWNSWVSCWQLWFPRRRSLGDGWSEREHVGHVPWATVSRLRGWSLKYHSASLERYDMVLSHRESLGDDLHCGLQGTLQGKLQWTQVSSGGCSEFLKPLGAAKIRDFISIRSSWEMGRPSISIRGWFHVLFSIATNVPDEPPVWLVFASAGLPADADGDQTYHSMGQQPWPPATSICSQQTIAAGPVSGTPKTPWNPCYKRFGLAPARWNAMTSLGRPNLAQIHRSKVKIIQLHNVYMLIQWLYAHTLRMSTYIIQ